jgi:pheromone shutdown protein TraB
MKQVILIGTIHLNWTPKDELIEEIKKYSPDKLLIELTEKEVKDGPEKSIRDEMFFALNYAKEAGVEYHLFDTDISTMKLGVTGKEPEFEEYEIQVKSLLAGKTWKDLNIEAYWKDPEVDKLDKFIVEKYYQKDLMDARNKTIEENIKANLVEGTNVVVTGAGHLTHLLEAFPDAMAPLRTKG